MSVNECIVDDIVGSEMNHDAGVIVVEETKVDVVNSKEEVVVVNSKDDGVDVNSLDVVVDVVDSTSAAIADTGGIDVVVVNSKDDVVDVNSLDVVDDVDSTSVAVADTGGVDVVVVNSLDVVVVNAKDVAVIVHVEETHDGSLLNVGPDMNQNESVDVGGEERFVCAMVAGLWDPGGTCTHDDKTRW